MYISIYNIYASSTCKHYFAYKLTFISLIGLKTHQHPPIYTFVTRFIYHIKYCRSDIEICNLNITRPVERKPLSSSVAGLTNALMAEWGQIPADSFQNVVERLLKRMKAVISMFGLVLDWNDRQLYSGLMFVSTYFWPFRLSTGIQNGNSCFFLVFLHCSSNNISICISYCLEVKGQAWTGWVKVLLKDTSAGVDTGRNLNVASWVNEWFPCCIIGVQYMYEWILINEWWGGLWNAKLNPKCKYIK